MLVFKSPLFPPHHVKTFGLSIIAPDCVIHAVKHRGHPTFMLSVYHCSPSEEWVLTNLKGSLWSSVPADTFFSSFEHFLPFQCCEMAQIFCVAHLYSPPPPILWCLSPLLFWVSFSSALGLLLFYCDSLVLRLTPNFSFSVALLWAEGLLFILVILSLRKVYCCFTIFSLFWKKNPWDFYCNETKFPKISLAVCASAALCWKITGNFDIVTKYQTFFTLV